MGKIKFKRVSSQDIEKIVKFKVDFVREMKSETASEKLDKLYEETEKYILAKIEEDSYIGFFGYRGEEIVCAVGLLLYELPPIFGNYDRKVGHVLNFYTLKEHRRKGYGTQMIEFLKKQAQEIGVKRLFLNATKMGEELYINSGFREREDKALVFDM